MAFITSSVCSMHCAWGLAADAERAEAARAEDYTRRAEVLAGRTHAATHAATHSSGKHNSDSPSTSTAATPAQQDVATVPADMSDPNMPSQTSPLDGCDPSSKGRCKRCIKPSDLQQSGHHLGTTRQNCGSVQTWNMLRFTACRTLLSCTVHCWHIC